MKKLLELIKYKTNTHTLLGHGAPIDKINGAIRPIWLPDTMRKGHLMCFGTTRIGKSRLIENLIVQDIKKGINTAFFDPKGDIELFEKIVQTAFACGRENDLILINPIFPGCSSKLDPLSHYYTLEELVSHIISGIKVKEGNEFFFQVANETAMAIVMGLDLLHQRDPDNAARINIDEIRKRCSHAALSRLRAELDNIGGQGGEKTEEVKAIIDKSLEYPSDFFTQITASLRTVLSGLTIGAVGDIIGKARSNRFIERLEAGKGVILVVQTGSMLTRKTSHMIGSVLLSMIQAYVGRKYAIGKTLELPLSIYIDEFAQLAYKEITSLFAQGGGANVWLNVFTQSLADLTENMGEAAARQLIDIINTKVVMRINEVSTAEYVENYSGTVAHYDHVAVLGGNLMIRASEKPAVRQNEILTLTPRTMYVFGMIGKFKARPEYVNPAFLKIQYPGIESHAVGVGQSS